MYLKKIRRRLPGNQTADAVVDVQAFLGRRVPGEATLSWAGRTPTPNAGGKAPQKIYWEGNILNKISKKIVALVTMAAFVLTLVPFAAFAASTDSKYTVEAVSYNTAKVSIDLGPTDESTYTGGNILVWAEDSEGNVLEYGVEATYSGAKVVPTFEEKGFDGGAFVGQLEDQTVDITFAKAGEYNIYVALNKDAANIEAAEPNKVTANGNASFYAWPAVSEQSQYGVIENDKVQAEATVEVDTDLETTFYVNDKDGVATGDALDNVVVWAVNEKGEVTGLSKVTPVDGKATSNGVESVGSDRYAYKLKDVENGAKVNVQFDAAGEYTLYAGVGLNYDAAKNATLDKTGTKTKVTVTDDSEITALDLKANVGTMTFNDDTDTYTLDLTGTDFAFDGNDKIVIDGTAYVGKKLATGKTINFETTAPKSVVEFWSTDNSTGNDGKFGTTITMQDKQNALISITDSEGNVEYTLRIVATKTTATNIDRTLTGGYVLAGTDKDYASAVYGQEKGVNKTVNFDDAVEFEITDQKGNPVTDGNVGATIDIKDQPKKSTLSTKDLSLVSLGNGKYTLAYKADNNDFATDLVEGEYTVRVSLPSEDNATVTFKAAEFGDIKDVEMKLATDKGYKLDDEVLLGDTVNVSLVYVDENGLKVPCQDKFSWSVKSPAHAVTADTDYAKGTFTLKADTIEHQGVIGSEVTVQAAVKDFGFVERALTIVDSYNEYSLEFDPTEGPVNEYNKVDVTVLEDDGDEARVNGDVKVYLIDSSNDDAKVSVDVNEKNQIVIYSDQETVLDIAVTVNNGEQIIAAGNLSYTVGKEDPLANRTVVMTIGSSNYIVNNNIVKGDAAPFVDSNWRTMVPLRALAESFDAEVIWDNDARTVTINYDANTQIVMTIGEETYTVNGEEMTMDTAPVIQGERTYVPVRFAAEGMGFTVTPLYDSNGLTASVVFQK